MTAFDLGTVILLHKTSLLAGSATLLLLWRRADRPEAVALIAGAFALLAIGAFLAGLGENGVLSPALWRDTSVGIAVCAYTLLYLGCRRLDRRIGARRWLFLLTPIVLALGLLTSLFEENVLRALLFHATAFLSSLLAGLELLRHRKREPLPSRGSLAAALLVSAFVYGAQIPLLASGLASAATLSIGFTATMMVNFAIAALIVSFVRERREELLRRVSLTDALTGAANRQGFQALVPATLPPGAALAVFDLDLFKQINDRHGHPAGDHVLVSFVRLMESLTEPGDVLARIGGEEFVLYLPARGAERARRLVETIRTALTAAEICWKGAAISVSTSVGLSLADGLEPIGREALFARADRALYLAKARGRNQVALACEEASDTASLVPGTILEPPALTPLMAF